MSEPRSEPPAVRIAQGHDHDTCYYYVAGQDEPPPASRAPADPRALFEQARAEAPAPEQDAEIEAIAGEWAALVDALAAVIRREVRAALEERGL